MALQLGDEAPDFTAETTEGTIHFHQWLGNSWGVLFSHPKDFTPVCTTELGRVSALKPEFEKRGVKVPVCRSTRSPRTSDWANDIKETQGHALNFPLIADPEQEGREPLRDDPPERERHADGALGVRHRPRQEDQADADLPGEHGPQLRRAAARDRLAPAHAKHKVATPSDWKQGQDVIIVPSVSDADAKQLFPAGWKTLRPYLRVTRSRSDRRGA